MLFDCGRDSIEPTTHEGIAVARIAYNIQGTISNVITPGMINLTYRNWKGKAGSSGLDYILFA